MALECLFYGGLVLLVTCTSQTIVEYPSGGSLTRRAARPPEFSGQGFCKTLVAHCEMFMAYRKPHGTGSKALARIEVLPADEQPVPTGLLPAVPARIDRRQDGRVADASSAKELGKRGGQKKADNRRLLAGLGIKIPPDGDPLRPYVLEAKRTMQEQIAALAAQAGGHVGPQAGAVLASAVIQLAHSRYLYDQGFKTGDADTLAQASKAANDSRQNMLAARELAIREAETLAEAGDTWRNYAPSSAPAVTMSRDEIERLERKLGLKGK